MKTTLSLAAVMCLLSLAFAAAFPNGQGGVYTIYTGSPKSTGDITIVAEVTYTSYLPDGSEGPKKTESISATVKAEDGLSPAEKAELLRGALADAVGDALNTPPDQAPLVDIPSGAGNTFQVQAADDRAGIATNITLKSVKIVGDKTRERNLIVPPNNVSVNDASGLAIFRMTGQFTGSSTNVDETSSRISVYSSTTNIDIFLNGNETATAVTDSVIEALSQMGFHAVFDLPSKALIVVLSNALPSVGISTDDSGLNLYYSSAALN